MRRLCLFIYFAYKNKMDSAAVHTQKIQGLKSAVRCKVFYLIEFRPQSEVTIYKPVLCDNHFHPTLQFFFMCRIIFTSVAFEIEALCWLFSHTLLFSYLSNTNAHRCMLCPISFKQTVRVVIYNHPVVIFLKRATVLLSTHSCSEANIALRSLFPKSMSGNVCEPLQKHRLYSCSLWCFAICMCNSALNTYAVLQWDSAAGFTI